MIYSVESQSYIKKIPHEKDYKLWMSRLSIDEHESIVNEIKSRIHGKEINTSSWIPGADWTDTVFMPIYEKACNRNYDHSAMCFGLMVWMVFMEDEDVWCFGNYNDKNGNPISGKTYFKIDPPRE